MYYSEMSAEEKAKELKSLKEQYALLKSQNLNLNMARGVLCKEQLELSVPMLGVLAESEQCFTESGTDCRNYGVLDGIPEAKKLMADILGVTTDMIIIGGNASLNLMYDAIMRNMVLGTENGTEPWLKQGKIKFLCPVPGYDRHFTICESLGIEMINIPMTEEGPDMDMVESLVASDEQIKGMWCVPKYSNPGGVVYSDEVITRLARLKPKAEDFRIMYDNAYVIHSLYGEPAKQLNIFEEAKKYGNEDMIYEFASTSKISFPGSGISCIATSPANIKVIVKRMGAQTIGHDKLNQLRHVKFFKDFAGVTEHMKKHAEIIAPKFSLVVDKFEKEFAPCGICSWSKPDGGYFVSLNVPRGCAAKVYDMMSELGVKLTPAGASFPYHKDPNDENLRIAPTFPPIEELDKACDALILCVKIAALEQN